MNFAGQRFGLRPICDLHVTETLRVIYRRGAQPGLCLSSQSSKRAAVAYSWASKTIWGMARPLVRDGDPGKKCLVLRLLCFVRLLWCSSGGRKSTPCKQTCRAQRNNEAERMADGPLVAPVEAGTEALDELADRLHQTEVSTSGSGCEH